MRVDAKCTQVRLADALAVRAQIKDVPVEAWSAEVKPHNMSPHVAATIQRSNAMAQKQRQSAHHRPLAATFEAEKPSINVRHGISHCCISSENITTNVRL